MPTIDGTDNALKTETVLCVQLGGRKLQLCFSAFRWSLKFEST